jgi:hypothetical protein
MGSSGNLSIIALKEYPFEAIKEHISNEILSFCPPYSFPDNEFEQLYWKVNELKNIDDFISLFLTKIADFCPPENGIQINDRFYGDWAGENMPQIIENHLILYDTDQQMSYQNLPTQCLRKLTMGSAEIWT